MLVLETIKSIFRYVDVGKRKGKAEEERREKASGEKRKKMRKGRRKEKNERIRSFRDAAVITTS
ncbi:hypothetical protein WN51_08981 [Melipona quadrifasciata]|uniref:Uncharacterized protein n=1 Tax=Melipona quadrifasciata TaxID=166423 RepID=A0A0M9A9P3_9HYME|nr:hypothetical protein WN51_08981 [Melipona quadrifasciata]